MHRRVLRRDEYELVCECGDCELTPIRVPDHVYDAARASPDKLLVDSGHVLDDAEVVAHYAGIAVVRRAPDGRPA